MRPPSFLLSKAAPFIALVLAVALVYANALFGSFLLDDEMLILTNRFLASFDTLPDLLTHCSTAGSGGTDHFWRPMQGLFYFLTLQTIGLNAIALHALTIALHAGCACLVFVLGKRLGFSVRASFVAALLWGVHPVHTEAISYISSIADPQFVLFGLWGLVVLFPDFSPIRIGASAFLIGLALLSKESALVFLPLVLVCFIYRRPTALTLRALIRFWPLGLVTGLYLWARLAVLRISDVTFYKQPNLYSDDTLVRLWTFLKTVPHYILTLLWPTQLVYDRPMMPSLDPWSLSVILGILVVALIVFLIIRPLLKRGNGREAAFASAWVSLSHVMHSGVFLAINSVFMEHWLYLPTIGLALGGAALCDKHLSAAKPRYLHATGLLVALVVLALGVLTYQQNKVWKNPVALYENMLAHGVDTAMLHNNLGMAYSADQRFSDAIHHYRRAIALNDIYAQTHHNLALLLFQTARLNPAFADRQRDESIAEFKRAIAMNPDFYQSYELLAQVYKTYGDTAKAALYGAQAAQIRAKLFGDPNL